MSESRLDLARARILVTNDDGIAAPGLKVLERIAKAQGQMIGQPLADDDGLRIGQNCF